LLPRGRLADLLIRHYHVLHFHAGVPQTISSEPVNEAPHASDPHSPLACHDNESSSPVRNAMPLTGRTTRRGRLVQLPTRYRQDI
jgi:hypothetical protein